jgi:uracil-DNA glycosylase family 4
MSKLHVLDPAEATFAILEELKRQRAEGVRHLYMEDSTLENLSDLFGGTKDSKVSQVIAPKSTISTHSITSASTERKLPYEQKEEVKKESTVSPVMESVVDPFPSNLAFANPPSIFLPEISKKEQWAWLKDRVLNCEVCQGELNPQAKTVFGVGNLDADLFFCGEAPGAEEEIAGKPFVGPAGELLDRIISAMGLSRDSVYIGNVVNFRPRHERSYGNRPPSLEEINFCLPYLRAQLEIVKPKVLVALGKTAMDGLLGPDPKRRLGQMRGNWHQYDGMPMMVTYHPSYLLHNPSKSSKRKVWEDMLKVMEKLELPISDKQRGFFQ